jgi:hypothetical protein
MTLSSGPNESKVPSTISPTWSNPVTPPPGASMHLVKIVVRERNRSRQSGRGMLRAMPCRQTRSGRHPLRQNHQVGGDQQRVDLKNTKSPDWPSGSSLYLSGLFSGVT